MMMRKFVLFVVALVATVSVACSSPTTPPPSGGSGGPGTPVAVVYSFTVKDGDKKVPLGGVFITTSFGKAGVTDASGTVSFESTTPGFGLEMAPSGFLKRETSQTGNAAVSQEILLWPISGEQEALWIKQIVYNDPSASSNAGLEPLARLMGPAYYVHPEGMPQVQIDRLKFAASKLQAVIGYPVGVGRTPTLGSAVFQVSIDPSIPAGAQASYSSPGGKITGGWIKFVDDDFSITTAIHEMGHTAGLHHHSYEGAMGFRDSSVLIDFSDWEKFVIKMMYLSRPGTESLHNDKSAILSPASLKFTSGGDKFVISCK